MSSGISEILISGRIKNGFRDFSREFKKRKNERKQIEYRKIKDGYKEKGGLMGGWSSRVMSYEEGLEDMKKKYVLYIPLGLIFVGAGIFFLIAPLFLKDRILSTISFAFGVFILILFASFIIFIQYWMRNPNTVRMAVIGFRKIGKRRILEEIYRMMDQYDGNYTTGKLIEGYPSEYQFQNGPRIKVEFTSTAFEPNGRLIIRYRLKDYEEAVLFQDHADKYLTGKDLVRNVHMGL